MREFPFAIDLDQFRTPQVGEMSRDDRLRKLENADDIANAQFSCYEQVQNSDASRIGKPTKQEIQVSETKRLTG